MTTYFMLGKYSPEGMKEMSADRTKKVVRLIKEAGGEVISIYALLGGYDLVIIVKLSDTETAMKTSLRLTLLTNISFSTFPAVSVEEFDKIIISK